MSAAYFRQKIANAIPSARMRNIALIQAWADDSTGYESCVLFSFRNACVREACEPTPATARAYAKVERDAGTKDCLATAETLDRLADKLEELS